MNTGFSFHNRIKFVVYIQFVITSRNYMYVLDTIVQLCLHIFYSKPWEPCPESSIKNKKERAEHLCLVRIWNIHPSYI